MTDRPAATALERRLLVEQLLQKSEPGSVPLRGLGRPLVGLVV